MPVELPELPVRKQGWRREACDEGREVFVALKPVDHQLFFALHNGLSFPWLDMVM